MDIKEALEHFVEQFKPEEYVLGGGLAVALQTGRERETKDIDVIAVGDIALRIYHYTIDYGAARIDICNLDYVRSILFTQELLKSNTDYLPFRGHQVPCLSREALVVSKLASLYSSNSPSERRIQPQNVPLRRLKDLSDFQHLYARGLDDDKVLELLKAVPHLAGTDLQSFYEVASRIVVDRSIQPEIAQNVFTIARLGSLCTSDKRERFLNAVQRIFTGRDAGTIGLLTDQLYQHHTQRKTNTGEELNNGTPHI